MAHTIRSPNAEPVAEDCGEIEDRRNQCDAEVGVRGPELGVVGPGGAVGGCAVGVGDGAVDVLRLEEFGDCHGYGGQDANGDEETEDAGYDAETADA